MPAVKPASRAYKVDIGMRIGAALIDAATGFILGLIFLLWGGQWRLLTLLLTGLYMLLRDGLPISALDYQSVGKKLLKLHVENEKTHKPRIDMALSAKRNATLAGGLLLAPVLGLVGGGIGIVVALLASVGLAVFEVMLVLKDPNGLRFGDKLAGTKVLD